MSYTVTTDVFEGPFDLLLHLVSRQRLDVASISVSEVIDRYLEYIEQMRELDLEVASDFLLVASILLEIKAARLIPEEAALIDVEFEELSPEEARDLLVARLLAYKKVKNAAGELGARMEAESRMHPREAPLEEAFLGLMPDFLEGIALRTLGVICADLVHRRDLFLLEAEHVTARPIPLEERVGVVAHLVRERKRTTFRELIPAGAGVDEFVVTFLSVLELYKRGSADIGQDADFGDIQIVAIDEEAA